MAIEEFVFEIVEGAVVQLKLPLEGAISHAAPLAPQGYHLIHDRNRVPAWRSASILAGDSIIA
jgi:hypothetical protein